MSIKLLIACPDQKGIVYEVTKFVFETGGNIIDSQQHSLGLDSHFFMRLDIDPSDMNNLMMDDMRLSSMYVRNYDEDDKA